MDPRDRACQVLLGFDLDPEVRRDLEEQITRAIEAALDEAEEAALPEHFRDVGGEG